MIKRDKMSTNLMEEYDNMKLSARFIGWGSIASLGEFLDAFAIVAWSFIRQSSTFGIISIKSNEPKDLSEFFEQFKKHKTISKIVGIKKSTNNLNLAFFESSGHMIADIMSNYPLLWYSNKVVHGKELWDIIIPKNFSNDLKKDLTDVARILNWSLEYNDKDMVYIYFPLTDIEFTTLRNAEKLGYFESPRKIDLGELSSTIGVSKQAASVTLRRAMKKLVHNNMSE